MDMEKVLKAAEELDPGLRAMLDVFCAGVVTSEIRPNLEGLKRKTSRDFSRTDLEMLRKAGIITPRDVEFALTGFKVKKKTPNLSRFITDCRAFNQRFTAFSEEKMNLPRLHTIMEWGVRYKVVWSIDAKAYFFQFRLKGEAEGWFPMQFDVEGRVSTYCMNRLPMGCKLAPIIAQRVSNLFIERTKRRLLKTKGGARRRSGGMGR